MLEFALALALAVIISLLSIPQKWTKDSVLHAILGLGFVVALILLVAKPDSLVAATWVMAIAVCVQAFAIVLALVNLKAVERQADLTHQTMVYTHRPKFTVRNIDVPALLNLNTISLRDWNPELDGSFKIANVGIMTGQPKDVYAQFFTGKTLPMQPPYDEGRVETIKIGEDVRGGASTEPIRIGLSLTREQAGEFIDGMDLYFMGFVNYTDDLYADDQHKKKFSRRMLFCYRYSPDLRRFIPLPNDRDYRDYNDTQ